MSRPRVRRTVAGMPRPVERGLERGDRRRATSRRSAPVGLYGIRFTLKAFGSSSARELGRLLDAVVHAREHHVLDEDLAPAQLDVAAALGEHVLERVAVVHRHQPRAERRVGGVEREREPDRLLDLVDEAASARAASRRSRSSCGGA